MQYHTPNSPKIFKNKFILKNIKKMNLVMPLKNMFEI